MDNNTLTPGEGIFQTSTVTFTTGARCQPNSGQALAIWLVSQIGPEVEVNFDVVTLNAVTAGGSDVLFINSFEG